MHELAILRKVTEAMKIERERFNTLLDMLPAYVVLLSPDYRVPFANRFFEERFGKSEGRRCYEYLFNRGEPCENCETFKVLKSGRPHRWGWTGPDGRDYDVHDFPFTDVDGARLIMEVGLDVTESKRANEELEEYRHRLEELVEERTNQLTAATAAAQQLATEAIQAAQTIRRLSVFPEENPNPVLRIARNGTILYANPVSGPLLAYWGLAGGQCLPEDWTRQLAAIADAGKPVEQEIECAGRVFACLLTPIAGEEYVNIYGRDVTDRKRREEQIDKLSRLYVVLSQVNEAIVRAHDAEALYADVCQIVAEKGGFPLVWIGRLQDQRVVPAAAGGPSAGYLDEINVQVDGELGRGPTGTCLRENRAVVNDDFEANPTTEPWRETAGRYGFRASAAFPLRCGGKPVAALTLYAADPHAFDAEQIGLLESLTADLSYALDAIDREQARTRAEEALLEAKEAAEAANVAKSQFLANMSHELRTPMNAILGMIDVALPKTADPVVKDCLQTAKASADILLTLLNDLLDSARIEAGKLELESVPFSLRRTLEQITRVLSLQASEKGLALHCRMPEGMPDAVVGDRVRLQQVLLNLAGNAIKFTERGEVEVSVVSPLPQAGEGQGVRAESAVRDGETVDLEFAVRDTGIGIPASAQERIFQRFAQADASMTRRFGGTGLGLSICKSLVEMMGGNIWVESVPGEGSTFHFTVRLPLAKELPPDLEFPVAATAPAKKLQILLVEDNPANQKVAAHILQGRGHAVKFAVNGHKAISLAERNRYDVILMDLGMPGMDGLEATAAIRKHEVERVPIIAMTAHATAADRQLCLAAGMDGYLSKPVDADEMIVVVESSAAGTAAPQDSEVTAARPPASPPAATIFDLAAATQACLNNRDLLGQIIDFFFKDADVLLPKIHAALQAGDLAEVGCLAHRLKGTLLHLGAEAAREAARRLEQLMLHGGEQADAEEGVAALDRQCELLKQALAPHRSPLPATGNHGAATE